VKIAGTVGTAATTRHAGTNDPAGSDRQAGTGTGTGRAADPSDATATTATTAASAASDGSDAGMGLAPPVLVVRGRKVDLSEPVVMGILNANPDSFSDPDRPHRRRDVDALVAQAVELVDRGAGMVDVGGQSGITGVPEVDAAEEIDRVVPVVAGLLAARPDVLISVDTYKPPVVAAALAAGAAIVNDVSGLRHPEVAALCAEAGAGLVIMHTRAAPKQRLQDPALYGDAGGDGTSAEVGVVGDVVGMLAARLDQAEAAGLPRESVLLDPGPDFAKTPHQTVTLLRGIERVRDLGRPLLLALSRKDFVGAITRRPPRQRLAGTLAAIGHLTRLLPATVLRVHDVAAVADYLKVAAVLEGRVDVPPDLALSSEIRHERPPAAI
jgi:dihydropteroate synthase